MGRSPARAGLKPPGILLFSFVMFLMLVDAPSKTLKADAALFRLANLYGLNKANGYVKLLFGCEDIQAAAR